MRKLTVLAALTALCLGMVPLAAGAREAPGKGTAAPATTREARDQQSVTYASVTVEGHRIDYKAVAGTIVLHVPGDDEHTPSASVFYVAYFKTGAKASHRPVTFLYNGGPGGSSFPLHMGAFGPRRIATTEPAHTPAAPYRLVNNDYSLLDVSDLVFIDAPGTGFSRLIAQAKDPDKRAALMKKRAKQFFSVDGDAAAFARFITRFLSKYGRWNSPKYLYGESYGTTRSVLVARDLAQDKAVDINGVILQSQVLDFATSVDGTSTVPGNDLPFALALPTYAATAWYHHKLPDRPAQLDPWLHEVEQFAMGPYIQGLLAGHRLDPARRQALAEKLHHYTGLPAAYWVKADLRVDGGMFDHALQGDDDTTTGRLDTRFSGPSMDPMDKSVTYDPLMTGIASAYVSMFNDYVRTTLKFGQDRNYRMFDMQAVRAWDYRHPKEWQGALGTNVMSDLAWVMKANPNLKVMMNGGYFDLATPYYAAEYELDHLPIPPKLQKNITVDLYPSGHMIYVNIPSLKQLHDNVAAFIHATDHQ